MAVFRWFGSRALLKRDTTCCLLITSSSPLSLPPRLMITILSNLSRLATSTAFWVSFVLSVFAYLFLASFCKTVKQRSWILTTLSSALMSFSSLPLLVQFACARGQLQQLSIPPVVTDSVCRFFQAYLIALVRSMCFVCFSVTNLP